jgi:broad specificity phosphatase PhoE
MSLNLYFLRHGETAASQTGGYCGRLNPGLTESSHLMARDFAAAYKDRRAQDDHAAKSGRPS